MDSTENNKFERKRRPAEGHEIPLSSMIKNGYLIKMELLNQKILIGKVLSFDKFTITLNVGDNHPMTVFKHAVCGFTRAEDWEASFL